MIVARRADRPRPVTRGFALIEALIALLIFTLATLGLVGLQVSMARANTSAKFRADAAAMANDLVGTVWADASHLNAYATASCPSYDLCKAWVGRLQARLPSAGYEIVTNGTDGTIKVTIRWTVPEEGVHTFETATAVNTNPSS
jgi:type IV pilus assembly protein PilV